jgi:hypothetical protein
MRKRRIDKSIHRRSGIQEVKNSQRQGPRNPETRYYIPCGEFVHGRPEGRDRVKEGPVDQGFHRDSIGSPKSRFGSVEKIERSLRPGGQARDLLR